MSANIKSCQNQTEFDAELTNAGGKLVVVDFFAEWCGPCQSSAPVFVQLASRYLAAVFIKVDVDKAQDVASRESITAMPTFNLYKSKVRIDSMRGADMAALEEKIKQHVTSAESSAEGGAGQSLVKGHSELNSMVSAAESECLNEADEHPFAHCLSPKGGFLESDCDEQLILHLAFNQTVKLHSLQIRAPVETALDKCPKTVKLFLNVPTTLDFDRAEGMDAVQTLVLSPEDMSADAVIPLKFVKFQNVGTLTVFVKDNQGGAETTQIDHLGLIGSPLNTTNMSDFKRVAGKKGESH